MLVDIMIRQTFHRYPNQSLPLEELDRHIGEVFMYDPGRGIRHGILQDIRNGHAYFSHIEWRHDADSTRTFFEEFEEVNLRLLRDIILCAYDPSSHKKCQLSRRLRGKYRNFSNQENP